MIIDWGISHLEIRDFFEGVSWGVIGGKRILEFSQEVSPRAKIDVFGVG